MKNILSNKHFFTMAILCILPFIAGCMASRPVIEVVNNTGYTAYSLHISDTTTDSWEEDLLSSDIINDGELFRVTLAFPLDVVNRYDIKLIDKDGDEYIRRDVLVRNGSRIAITNNDLVQQEQSGPVLEIVNNTGYTGYSLYVSQTATSDWEEDVLGNGVLLNGDSSRVTLLYPLNLVNRYDVKLVDEDGDKYIQRNILVRDGARVVITVNDYER